MKRLEPVEDWQTSLSDSPAKGTPGASVAGYTSSVAVSKSTAHENRSFCCRLEDEDRETPIACYKVLRPPSIIQIY